MKKKQHFPDHQRPGIKKLLLVMKLTTIFVFFSVMAIAANTYSQGTRFDLNVKNASIIQVFDEIERVSDYGFLFKTDQLDLNIKYSLDIKDANIEKILKEVLNQDEYSYRFIDRNIVITRIDSEFIQDNKAIKVSGKVTDTSGTLMPGVSVVVKGTTNGTITDINGNYTLSNVPSDATLQFSFVGMRTQDEAVGGKTVINVTLAEETIGIEEVVAIGYGTMKKGDVTSSVATVKADDFIKGSVTDAGQLIQGKVAGLTIISPSGDPTSRTQILLRGNTSLMGKNQDPLVLIDGIPGDMKTVSPQDIETIDVLKDGSAAAIYGTRGTNGVILITTKRARGDAKSTLEYQSYVSTQTIARQLNLSTAADFRDQVTAGFRKNEMPDYGESTDWFKEISRTPLIQSHNLTFRGGKETTNYLVSLNYNNSEGIFRKSFNEVFSGRVDFNHSMFDSKLKFNINLFSSSSRRNSDGGGGGFNSNIYRQSIMQNPTAPVKNPDGTWFQELTKFDYQSPVSDLYESDGKADNQISRYKGSVVYAPIDGLKLSGVFSYGKSNENLGYAETKQHASTLRDSRNGYARVWGNESVDRLVELTAEYMKSVKDHNFTFLGGYSYQEREYKEQSMTNWDFPTDKFGYNNIQLGQAISSGKYDGLIGNYREKTNLIGFFGRFNYNYNNKYLLMASIRREEASQLWGTDNPWGTFPAVSVGWRITEESFMQNQSLFNDIKLRAGYGVTGSQPSDLFKAVGIIDYGYGYVYSNGKWIKTLVPASNPNPDLKWEEKRETDIGVDFSMLGNRISGSIDYYNRQIHDLLSIFAVPSPPNLYNQTLANVGVMENKGLEVMLNFIPVKNRDMIWSTNVGFSTNTNKLVSLSNDIYQQSTDYLRVGAIFPPIQTFSHLLRVGGPVGDFYGYKVIDIGNDNAGDPGNYGQWVYEGADGQPVKYTDFKHSFEDKKVLGNGIPKFHLSWNNTFNYKNWDLTITQRGAFKFQVANLQRMMFENPTYVQYNVLKTAFDPVFGKTQLKSPLEFNSYYVENGDYWKVDNITIGYNFNNKTGIKYIQSARVYASVLNALIITGYKGIDPEVSIRNARSTAQAGVVQTPTSGLDPGMDSPYKYPTARTFTIGLNVTF